MIIFLENDFIERKLKRYFHPFNMNINLQGIKKNIERFCRNIIKTYNLFEFDFHVRKFQKCTLFNFMYLSACFV